MKEVKCPSGAILKITLSPFSDSKALYHAVLRELRTVSIDPSLTAASMYKDLFCAGFSSLEVESCLEKCLERCTYNSGKGDFRITKETFEPVEAREDYLTVCMEVAKENVGPFAKSLYAEFKRALAMTDVTPT